MPRLRYHDLPYRRCEITSLSLMTKRTALAVLFLHYEGVSRETINEDSKGEERSRQMIGRVRSSTGDNGCSIRINMFHVKHLSHCCETLRFMFHVKQSALAIFDIFLGAAFVRLTHEA